MTTLPKPLQHFKEGAEALLEKLEEKRETVVIPLMYSMNRFIAKPDVDAIYEALSSAGEQPKIDVILFSRGGDPDQAYLIGTMLQEFAKEKLTIIVPRFAKSAATLIVCAADEIIMLLPSELGPIEPVVESPETKRYVPVLSLLEFVELLGKMELSAETVKEMLGRMPVTELGDYRRLAEHTASLAEKLLARRMFKDQPDAAERVAKAFSGYKSHSASITLRDVKELGLKMADSPKDVLGMVWALHKLWVDTVIEYENQFSEGATLETLNLNVGRGIIFCTQPSLKKT